MTIVVDVYEPDHIPKMLAEKGLQIEVKPLIVADYLVRDVLIERKEIHDLISSVRSGRVWNQLYNMMMTSTESYCKSLVALVGDIPRFPRYKTKMTPQQFFLMNKNIVDSFRVISFISYNIPTYTFQSESDFVDFVAYVYERSSSKEPTLKPVPKKKTDPLEIKSDMLSCIPGVGRKVANELSKMYLFKDLVNVPEEELSDLRIDGRRLGQKGKSISDILRL